MLGMQCVLFLLENNLLMLVLIFDEVNTCRSNCSSLVGCLNDHVLHIAQTEYVTRMAMEMGRDWKNDCIVGGK